MFTRSKHTVPGAIARLAAGLSAAAPVSAQVSTVLDPVGDARFNAPAFRDVVFGRVTKTVSGDFHLLMELAGPVPANPPMPPPARAEIWWAWGFNLDPTTSPRGWPNPAMIGVGLPAEFVVIVSWDGVAFAGTAVDRRPLLTGGEATFTPVAFSVDGTIIEADLPYGLIGDVPSSFEWDTFLWDWAAPVGSSGAFVAVDLSFAFFIP